MQTRHVDLSAEECRERIAGGGVGRVVWCDNGRPHIYPVNYAVVDGDIVFRTAPYTHLGTQVAGRSVLFEVDDLDFEQRHGWSVVVRADSAVIDDPDEVARLRRTGPQPWASGQRGLFVRLRVLKLSGRHVGGES